MIFNWPLYRGNYDDGNFKMLVFDAESVADVEIENVADLSQHLKPTSEYCNQHNSPSTTVTNTESTLIYRQLTASSASSSDATV